VDSTIGLSSRADFVVIGTGAGGSTVAHRLAVAGVKVLLVEQGEHLPTRVIAHEVGKKGLRWESEFDSPYG